jgi:HEAT repeat protein
VLAKLIVMLGAKEPFVRESAAVTLGALGPDAKDALPELKELATSDGQERVLRFAAEAVKRIEAK